MPIDVFVECLASENSAGLQYQSRAHRRRIKILYGQIERAYPRRFTGIDAIGDGGADAAGINLL